MTAIVETRQGKVRGSAADGVITFKGIRYAEILAGAVAAYGLPVDVTLAVYCAANPNASSGELLAAIQGDWYVGIPAVRLADAHANSTADGRGTTYTAGQPCTSTQRQRS